MLDTRTHDWMSRLQAIGPRAVSLLFALLILFELVQIGYSQLSKPLKVPQPSAPAIKAAEPHNRSEPYSRP